MTDKKSSDSRRKLLKSIAAGSGAIVAGKSLPESWSRPAVDSVFLPAHAQTSGQIYSTVNFQPPIGNAGKINTHSDSMMAGLLNTVISPANADNPDVFLRGCAVVTGENVEFWVQLLPLVPVYITGSIPLIGTGQATRAAPCDGAPPPDTVPVSVVEHNTGAYIDIDINEGLILRFPDAQSCVEQLDLSQFCLPL